ncbi:MULTISPECIES: class F sortase [unclassified Frigoribacterium]|uniref:class F sortase n=1 Tax=unclassified Frigoribacterium TaxID=2627005 RepID=UPI0006FB1E7B|nr:MULTISPECIES: class F sortase [unclassified Frigoribacterium]KQO47691.1 sortase [Frigoribacterium sp. Leaf254]KQT39784.1 sortase [Frigoribacterium sp. Leaf415]
MGRSLPSVVIVAAVVLALTGCAAPGAVAPTTAPTPGAGADASATAAPSATGTAPPAIDGVDGVVGEGVVPAAVSVPAIGLDAPLIDLGIADDGTMEVPVDADDVGWFTGGGKPGGRGPTVIAAHVDSASGPAVFARLDELVVGDRVDVTTVDGGVVSYAVTEVVDVPKAEFPTARVFGAQPTDQLRLITCGGVFDRGSGHYDQNRIVFAEPVA